jgi:hypothetical protein
VNSSNHNAEARPDGLTGFQIEVARLFFTLPSSAGFVLAGGAALLAQHLTARPTRDLGFFTSQGPGDVTTEAEGFEAATAERGWTITRVREATRSSDSSSAVQNTSWSTSPRLPAWQTAHSQPCGTDLRPRGTGRSQGRRPLRPRGGTRLRRRLHTRDRFGKRLLLTRAADIDPGFSPHIFADMLRTLDR